MRYDALLWTVDNLCVHSRSRECKCRSNSTAQKKYTAMQLWYVTLKKMCTHFSMAKMMLIKMEEELREKVLPLQSAFFMSSICIREIESFLKVVLVINQKPVFRFMWWLFIQLLCDNLNKCAKIYWMESNLCQISSFTFTSLMNSIKTI